MILPQILGNYVVGVFENGRGLGFLSLSFTVACGDRGGAVMLCLQTEDARSFFDRSDQYTFHEESLDEGVDQQNRHRCHGDVGEFHRFRGDSQQLCHDARILRIEPGILARIVRQDVRSVAAGGSLDQHRVSQKRLQRPQFWVLYIE